MTDRTDPTRRGLLGGGAALAALAPAPLLAKGDDLADVRKAVAADKPAAVKRLKDWVALPSIAAENRNMAEGAAYMAQLARDAGFQHAEIVPTDGHPGVFATLDAGARRTLGLYFMYDVKQYDASEWTLGQPLEGRMVEKKGVGTVMIGRGVANQKGAETGFLAAVRAIRAAGRRLPVNLVLICEGEEEVGSSHIRQLVTTPKVLAAFKRCEGVLMPTIAQDLDGNADIELGAKGILEIELISSGEKWGRGPSQDTHSSMKAMVDSPVWRLILALQTLVTPDGNRPAIDGWFQNVRPLTDRERQLVHDIASHSNEAAMKKDVGGVTHWIDDWPLEEAMRHLVADPTINIEGLVAGYTGPGGKTVLPHRAVAKIDFRLVPNQTRAEAQAKLRAHLDKRGYSDIEIKVGGGYDPTETDEKSRLIRAEIATYTKLGFRPALNPRLAGSWPGGTFTQAPVSLPVGRFGLGVGGNAHAPDEFHLIDSSNPKAAGWVDQVMAYAEILFAFAAIK